VRRTILLTDSTARLDCRVDDIDNMLLVVQVNVTSITLRENYNYSAISVRFWHLGAVSMECAHRGNPHNTRVSDA
jgi:hypothetical protein